MLLRVVSAPTELFVASSGLAALGVGMLLQSSFSGVPEGWFDLVGGSGISLMENAGSQEKRQNH